MLLLSNLLRRPVFLFCFSLLTGMTLLLPLSVMASGNPTKGFQIDSKQPIEINSDTLSVDNNNQSAVFNGNVQVAQSNLRLKSNSLTVLYDTSAKTKPADSVNTATSTNTAEPSSGMGASTDSIRSLTADGNVFVTSPEGSAKGQKAVYDVPRQFLTVTGDVVLNQGGSVLKGEKLVINVKTGISTISGGSASGGRVKTIFKPSSQKE